MPKIKYASLMGGAAFHSLLSEGNLAGEIHLKLPLFFV
jgi:hypothetical protein